MGKCLEILKNSFWSTLLIQLSNLPYSLRIFRVFKFYICRYKAHPEGKYLWNKKYCCCCTAAPVGFSCSHDPSHHSPWWSDRERPAFTCTAAIRVGLRSSQINTVFGEGTKNSQKKRVMDGKGYKLMTTYDRVGLGDFGSAPVMRSSGIPSYMTRTLTA